MRYPYVVVLTLSPLTLGCGGQQAPMKGKPAPGTTVPKVAVAPDKSIRDGDKEKRPAPEKAEPEKPTLAPFAVEPASREAAMAAFMAVQKNQGKLVYSDDGGRTVREFRLLLGGLNEAMVKAIKWFPEVESLQLSSNVQEPWLRHLKPLTKLKSLTLSGAKVSDDALKYIEGFGKLEELRVDGTGVTDAGMTTLARIRSLRTLVLIGTKIGDAGLDTLKALPNPQVLSVRNTRVTSAGVETFQKAHPECKVIH